MSMSRVNVGAAIQITGTIRSLLLEQLQILDEYRNAISQFEGVWYGEGYRAYVSMFDDIRPKTTAHFENMMSYNNDIINLLEILQRADNASASLFENV